MIKLLQVKTMVFETLIIGLLTIPSFIFAGGISGMIVDELGSPITETIEVQATLSQTDNWSTPVVTQDGSYEITNLDEGFYWVRARATEPNTWLYRAYHPGEWSQDYAWNVYVTQAEVTPNINVTLREGGKITGTVHPGEGGEFPANSILATVYRYSWEEGEVFLLQDAVGYILGPIPEGSVYVYYEPVNEGDPHLGVFYQYCFDLDNADEIQVQTCQVTQNINVQLPLSGGVSGTVTGEGLPLLNAFVVVQTMPETGGDWDIEMLGYAMTDLNGDYTVAGIPTGMVLVGFMPPQGTDFVFEYYDDTYTPLLATGVEVIADQTTTGIDADLIRGARVSGTIQDPDGNLPPEESVAIELISSYGEFIGYKTHNEADGSWEIQQAMMPGIYTIRIDPPDEEATWAYSFLGDVFPPWEATWVECESGAQVGPYDLTIMEGGMIQGIVTDPDGNPTQYADIGAYIGNYHVEGSSPNENGEFYIKHLPPGEYTLMAELEPDEDEDNYDFYEQHPWAIVFSGGSNWREEATTITLAAGETRVHDLQFTAGGIISIDITKPGGGYYTQEDNIWIYLMAYKSTGESVWDVTNTQDEPGFASGPAYIILPPGNYKVAGLPVVVATDPDIIPPNPRRTFYGGGFNFPSGSLATVIEGNITNISIEMAEEGYSLSGAFLSEDAELLFPPTVICYQADNEMVAASTIFSYVSNLELTYQLQGLPNGTYYLMAFPTFGEASFFVSTWYPNIGDPSSGSEPSMVEIHPNAQAVTVNNGEVTGIDIVMQHGEYQVTVPEPPAAAIVKGFALHGAFPNPFNETTRVLFTTPTTAEVSLVVYDVLGREVKRLTDQHYTAGIHQVQFDAEGLSSGMYFIRMTAGGREITKKVSLIK